MLLPINMDPSHSATVRPYGKQEVKRRFIDEKLIRQGEQRMLQHGNTDLSSFVYLQLFPHSASDFSTHSAQSCVIRPSYMDEKGLKGIPDSFKGLSSPSYHHVKLKTSQFAASPPRQTSKRSKAWESFQRVFLFIYAFVGGGVYCLQLMSFFFPLLQ